MLLRGEIVANSGQVDGCSEVASRRLLYSCGGKGRRVVSCLVIGCGSVMEGGTHTVCLLKKRGRSLVRRKVVNLVGTIQSFSMARGASFSDFTRLYISERVCSTVRTSGQGGRLPLGSCVSLCRSDRRRKRKEDLPLVSAVRSSGRGSPRILCFKGRCARTFTRRLGRLLDPLRGRILCLRLVKASCEAVTRLLKGDPGSISGTLRQVGAGTRGVLPWEEGASRRGVRLPFNAYDLSDSRSLLWRVQVRRFLPNHG